MFKYNVLLLFILTVFGVAGQTNVNIICAESGATLYVNGEKKVTLEAKSTPILLAKGHYELMVTKPLDEDWRMVGRKTIDVSSESQMQVNLGLDIEKISKKKNTSSADNFAKAKDTVVDKAGKLVWQDDDAVTHVKKNWLDAQAYCKAYGDGKSWRLPNYDELISIVDYTKHTLAVMPAFEHIVSEYYWTSTEEEKNTKNVKNVYFGNGCPDGKSKTKEYFIRCVRPQ